MLTTIRKEVGYQVFCNILVAFLLSLDVRLFAHDTPASLKPKMDTAVDELYYCREHAVQLCGNQKIKWIYGTRVLQV